LTHYIFLYVNIFATAYYKTKSFLKIFK